MAGVAATAADKPNSGDIPDALAFNVERGHYRFLIGLLASFILLLAVLMIVMPIDGHFVMTLIALIALLALGLASSVKPLRLSGSVLRIDGDGIFDRRLTRETIPWPKINRVYVDQIKDDPKGPTAFVVAIDVGNRRHTGIKLTPETVFSFHRLVSGIGWDHLVIDVQGLAVKLPRDDAALARQIADYANAMRVRHARADKETCRLKGSALKWPV